LNKVDIGNNNKQISKYKHIRRNTVDDYDLHMKGNKNTKRSNKINKKHRNPIKNKTLINKELLDNDSFKK